ncbi:MAG: tRNA (adenosine(37)-N6)-threonylcarbamoyltransferase complex dimerization subunit type 1 TsaB [Candidatus Meridianibacter frigidus]|nr:MAG: tRNA (adenosine(37)-N6)-threonylcarbamoyltransferase complex dimerization subunit type 1 TsaB [Candidatus Eremiobacteraeota bacterium]
MDGALGAFRCALVRGDKTLSEGSAATNRALEDGLGLIARTLAEASICAQDVDRIAAGTGPGSFTGLRIAVSYAKSLALGWKRPLVGVSCFDALEFGIEAVPRLCVISARPGVASVRLLDGDMRHRASGSAAAVADSVRSWLPGGRLACTGAAEDVLSALAERGFAVDILGSSFAPAQAIAMLASRRVPAANAHEVRADYGELPPAKIPKRK